MKPTKCNIIGEQAWHLFKDKHGKVVLVECTVSEYESLSLPNPVNPTKKDCEWLASYKDWKYDTPSGRLERGRYVEVGDQILVHVDDVKEKNPRDGNAPQKYLPKEKLNDINAWL